MLYPAHSRVDRENLVLRHFESHFPPNSRGIACWVAELNVALCLDTKAEELRVEVKITTSRVYSQTLVALNRYVPVNVVLIIQSNVFFVKFLGWAQDHSGVGTDHSTIPIPMPMLESKKTQSSLILRSQ